MNHANYLSFDDASVSAIVRSLRQIRLQQQITQGTLARILGYSVSRLSQIENGYSRPSYDFVSRYAEALTVDLDSIITTLLPLPPESVVATPAENSVRQELQQIITLREGLITSTYAASIRASKDYIDILENWIGDDIDLLEQDFREAIERGVVIRLALLDPESEVARLRHADLYYNAVQSINVFSIMRHNLESLQRWHARLPQLQIRYHSSLPSLQMIRCDNFAFVGFYFHGILSRQGPQIDVELRDKSGKQTTLGFYLEREFEYIWNRAHDIQARP